MSGDWDDEAGLAALEAIENERTSKTKKSASTKKATAAEASTNRKKPTTKNETPKGRGRKAPKEDEDEAFEKEDQQNEVQDSTEVSVEDEEDEESESDDNSDDSEDDEIEEGEENPKTKKARTTAEKNPKTAKSKAPPKKSAGPSTKLNGTPTSSVLDYLKQRNRPYSAAVLVLNLGNEIPLSKLKKLLDDGVASGDLWESGDTSKVYYPNQDKMPDAAPTELEKFKKELQLLEKSVQEDARQQDLNQGKVNRLQATPSDSELNGVLKRLQDAVTGGEKELDAYKARQNSLKMEKPLVVADLRTEFEFWNYHAKRQSQTVVSALKNMSEPFNRNWKDIADEACILLD